MDNGVFITIWGIFVTIVLLPFGYFIKKTITQVDTIQTQISECKVEMAKEYISKVDFKEGLHRIETQLDQIYNLLQHKQDK